MQMVNESERESTSESDPMSHAERGKLGGRPPKAPPEEVLATVAAVIEETGRPIARTSDVSARLDIGEQATRDRLNELADEGRIESLRVGSGKVWWVEDGEEGA